MAAATLLERHRWNEHTRWVSDGFVGGRCGGAAPAQGRAEGPTAQMTMRGRGQARLLASIKFANQLALVRDWETGMAAIVEVMAVGA